MNEEKLRQQESGIRAGNLRVRESGISRQKFVSVFFSQFFYKFPLRLTDSVDFEAGKPIPLLMKIDALYNIFHSLYKNKWNILFEDVLRLTTKKEIAEITVKEWKILQNNMGKLSTLLYNHQRMRQCVFLNQIMYNV